MKIFSNFINKLTPTNNGEFDLSRIKINNLFYNTALKEEMLKPQNIEIARFSKYRPHVDKAVNTTESQINYETPNTLPHNILANINTYRFKYNNSFFVNIGNVKKKDENGKETSEVEPAFIQTEVTPSLFNPLFNVQIIGMTNNVPLVNDIIINNNSENSDFDYNLNDCSIKELVRCSHMYNSILGNARYKYADFMYCKELGQIPNNHLITLRKFAHPVGDNIFKLSTSKYTPEGGWDQLGDVGRMVTWFGTEENKLENILKYDYSASWKPLEAQIKEYESKEDNAENRGPLGLLLNTINPTYNKYVENNWTGDHNLWTKLGMKLGSKPKPYSDAIETLHNYDANKIYTPRNTIWNTHKYEGKLSFEQEFNLIFNYKIRGYDNINAKSAMLDLLANVLEVTYRRGSFWGGQQKMIGPSPNVSGWNKVNAFVDNAWDKLGGFLQGLATGAFDLSSILGKLSSMVVDGANTVVNAAQDVANKGIKEASKGLLQNVIEFSKTHAIDSALKGQLKNALGRPALYAMDSLLTGDNVGLWHVTIGNPKNPIMSIGNLILTKASIQHYGPLGIDDFPTDLKVTVTLKHARGRDIVDISKMYTQGTNSIYMPFAENNITNFIKYNHSEFINEKDINGTLEEIHKHNSNSATADNPVPSTKLLKDNVHYITEMNNLEANYSNENAKTDATEFITEKNRFLSMTNQDRLITAKIVVDEIA